MNEVIDFFNVLPPKLDLYGSIRTDSTNFKISFLSEELKNLHYIKFKTFNIIPIGTKRS